jgi:hypothetical protein
LMAGKVKSEDVVGGNDIAPVSGGGNSTSFITSTDAYVLSPAVNSNSTLYPNIWHSTPITGIPFMKSVNSFLTSTNAYIFGPQQYIDASPNTWHSFPISGQPIKIISTAGNVVVATSTNGYAYLRFNNSAFNWTPISISGTVIDVKIGLGIIGILTSTNVYVYGSNSTGSANEWVSIPISGTPLKIKCINAYSIMAITSTNAYLYCGDAYDFNGGANYSWHNTPISGTIILD